MALSQPLKIATTHLEKIKWCKTCLIVLPLIILIGLLFYFPNILNPLITCLFLISIIYIVSMIMKEKGNVTKTLFSLLILSFFGMFYYIAGMQIGSTIAVLIQQKIDMGEIHLALPASVFASLYTILIVIFAPAINTLWQQLHHKGVDFNFIHKLSLGIACGGLSLLCFAIASLLHAPLTVIIFGIALLSLGELILAPAIYTALSHYTPTNLKSSMMGAWLLFVALGGFLSSALTRVWIHLTIHISNASFYVFTLNGILVICGAIILYLFRHKLYQYINL